MENSVYNKVYKTGLHDRPKLVIPLINEIFQEQYKGQEQIEFLESTHYLKDPDGKLVERTNDGHFQVLDERKESFHVEAQSTPDTSMIQRVYEYDSGIAFTYRKVNGAEMTVRFPRSAVLFLRHTANTPDVMRIFVETQSGVSVHEVAVLKLGDYFLDDIFAKKLLILIPFHIFVYENKFMVYNNSKEELEKIKDVFRRILVHLDMLVEKKELDAYDRYFLISMTVKVVENLAEKYENVVKGVKEVMMGSGIDYPGRDIYYEGRALGHEEGRGIGLEEGRKEGLAAGERKAYLALFKDGVITLKEVAKRLNVSEEVVKSYL